LRKLGHGVERIGDVEELGLGADDESTPRTDARRTVSFSRGIMTSSPG
jgi:hypothetical protein